MNANSLEDRAILITGASQGIGAAIAKRLCADGAIVWISDRPEKERQALELIESVDAEAHFVPIDVTSDLSVAQALATIAEAKKPLYGLVNNAGVVGVGGFLETTLDELDLQWEVNAKGSYRLAQAVLPQMLEKEEGVIVQIASVGSLLVPRNRAAYAVSKHAALAIPRVIAEEFACRGIRANAICPTRVATDAAMERASSSAEAWADMHSTQASGKMVQPEAIAELVRTTLLPIMTGLNGDTLTLSDAGVNSLRKANFSEEDVPRMLRE